MDRPTMIGRLARVLGSTASMVVLVVSAGCVGAAASVEQVGADAEGIYKIETHTQNEGSCDIEGASVLDAESAGYLALYTNTAMGEQIVQVTACSGVADCREKTNQSRAMGSYWTSFELAFSEVDSGALQGHQVSTGSASQAENDPCYGTVSEHRLEVEADTIRVEQRSTKIDAFPKEGRFCTAEAAREAAREVSCSRLLVITAAREAEIDPGGPGG